MGNCFSAEEDPAVVLRGLINKADNGEGVESDLDIPLTADMIARGLSEVARILHQKGRQIAIVAVGGAVNTLYLRSRTQTSDVDFFYRTKLKDEDVSAIVKAAEAAAKTIQVGDTWLNNHTALFIQQDKIAGLYEESVTQGVQIFNEPGLCVLAAPWRYAFATKVDRLAKILTDKDMGDAVAYLAKHIEYTNNAVSYRDIEEWHAEFKFGVPSREVLVKINDKYESEHGGNGILF